MRVIKRLTCPLSITFDTEPYAKGHIVEFRVTSIDADGALGLPSEMASIRLNGAGALIKEQDYPGDL